MKKNHALIFVALLFFVSNIKGQQHSFELGDSVFLLDNKPFQMISGEMHYARIPKEAWRSRMRAARAMGLNTIGTYVFWNIHEPEKGKFNFIGNSDIAAFVKIAQEEGLWVVLRPSPYVCAEWEFGGYPYWLQNEKGLIVRSKEKKYLQEYKNYLLALGKQLAPLQVNHGGNILMVQLENEYGAYGKDQEYLEVNRQIFLDAGFDGLLFTCDQANDIANGRLPDLFTAVNGTDNPEIVKTIIKKNHNGKGPFYIAEWYPAWFDWWGTKHHTVEINKYSSLLDSVLSAGISINMYMFHGGTSRGFMNGANLNEGTPFEPEISSYDYDAPLDEAGNPTAKFHAFRTVIQKHLPANQILPPVPALKESIAINDIKFSQAKSIFNILPTPQKNKTPLTFEDLNQAYGYVLYRAIVQGGGAGKLEVKDLRDYGIVFLNGKQVGVLDRRSNKNSLDIVMPNGNVTLDILVENLGRINYGSHLLDNKKGITDKVLFNNKEIYQWQMFSLPFDTIFNVKTNSKNIYGPKTPTLKVGSFNLEKLGDTYIDFSNWGKGIVFVNGHHLGRYWNIGPQQTVYLPVDWLKKGKNEIAVFELLKPNQNVLKCVDKPILDKLQ